MPGILLTGLLIDHECMRHDGKPRDISDLLVGAGEIRPVNVPRYNQENRMIGYWKKIEQTGFIMKLFLLFLLLVGSVSTGSADGYRGTGDNWGRGWENDGRGGYRGTGKNWGQGWESDGRGGYRGTGENWGKGWESDGRGGYRGTGDNWGKGWESDGHGGYRGTGENWGQNWQSDGRGGFRGNGENWGKGWSR